MSTAWFTPAGFSPIPVDRSSQTVVGASDGEDDDEEEEKPQEELLKSVEYVCGLIGEEIEKGVDIKRIVVGGFSQGCAVSLVTALGSRYGGRLAGMVGLSGYLPPGKRIRRELEGFLADESKLMKVFLAHGTKDMLVPVRMFRRSKEKVGKIVGEKMLEAHEYEGMGHVTSGVEFKDMCEFLEKLIPG